MRIYHTHFGVPLGIAPSWWNDRQISHKPVLPLYLCLDISDNLSRALSCLCLSGHNVLVQRMRHNRNRRPSYFLWAQNLWLAHCSGWGIHFTGLSDEHLVSLRTQHRQLVFPLQNEDGPTRLKTFLNQPDIVWPGLFCGWEPSPFPFYFLVFVWSGFRLFPSFRSDVPQGHYSDVTLPNPEP